MKYKLLSILLPCLFSANIFNGKNIYQKIYEIKISAENTSSIDTRQGRFRIGAQNNLYDHLSEAVREKRTRFALKI